MTARASAKPRHEIAKAEEAERVRLSEAAETALAEVEAQPDWDKNWDEFDVTELAVPLKRTTEPRSGAAPRAELPVDRPQEPLAAQLAATQAPAVGVLGQIGLANALQAYSGTGVYSTAATIGRQIGGATIISVEKESNGWFVAMITRIGPPIHPERFGPGGDVLVWLTKLATGYDAALVAVNEAADLTGEQLETLAVNANCIVALVRPDVRVEWSPKQLAAKASAPAGAAEPVVAKPAPVTVAVPKAPLGWLSAVRELVQGQPETVEAWDGSR